MRWSDVDWTATEAVVWRIQDRIVRAAKIKRPRLEPDDKQSSVPVLRGLGTGTGARLPDDSLCSRTCGDVPSCGLQDGQHGRGPPEVEQSAAIGGNMLVVAGAEAEKVAEFIVSPAEPSG